MELFVNKSDDFCAGQELIFGPRDGRRQRPPPKLDGVCQPSGRLQCAISATGQFNFSGSGHKLNSEGFFFNQGPLQTYNLGFVSLRQ